MRVISPVKHITCAIRAVQFSATQLKRFSIEMYANINECIININEWTLAVATRYFLQTPEGTNCVAFLQ